MRDPVLVFVIIGLVLIILALLAVIRIQQVDMYNMKVKAMMDTAYYWCRDHGRDMEDTISRIMRFTDSSRADVIRYLRLYHKLDV
jgi:hypothetical protein